MRFKVALIAVALTAALFATRAGGVNAAANPDRACLVGVIVSNSAGPGFGPETADLAQAGLLDPAGVAADNCR